MTSSLHPLLLQLLLLLPFSPPPSASAARFACGGGTCQSLLGYAPPNATTLAEVKSLFQLRSLRGSLLAPNSLPLSTPSSLPLPAASLLRLRLPCSCSRGVGASFRRPLYKVKAGDTLDAIARGTFAGFVTSGEIAAANNLSDPNRVAVGQQLYVPLPCSCDAVGGEEVVHYAHAVAAGSSVAEIAAEFGTTEETLMRLNGIKDPNDLQAGQILDVPLRACSSSISSTSVDRNLRVPNGSYILTANNCVLCSCSSSSWQLDCHPTQGISSSTCPAAMCGNMFLGNTSSSSPCERATCAYTGYTNKTSSFAILTNLTIQSLCNTSGAPPLSQPTSGAALSLGLQGVKLTELLIFFHIALLCLAFLSRC
uniref:LysM domain-containing protein n=1 Tax=Ananas comosus var. bracteatus TaxID=296719 RepID=A0A6V7NRP1_ANACO|nr:unnamed protein product [Ananas comosus var. bracteatus]